MERGEKKELLTPGKWLRIDRVILNKFWWSVGYLCEMGVDWSLRGIDSPLDAGDGGVIFEVFSSRKMGGVRPILQ